MVKSVCMFNVCLNDYKSKVKIDIATPCRIFLK